MTNTVVGSDSNKSNSEHIEINIWLDTYNEMFSDFDPSPYVRRTISDDFISQVRKVVKGQYRKDMTLQLWMPEGTRNLQDEHVMIDRIHHYFQLHKNQLLEERRKLNRKGILLTVVGIILMLIAGFISFQTSKSLYSHVLRILFEPAGWFMLWMGLDQIVLFSGSKRKELDFYIHMANTGIKFGTYSLDGTLQTRT